MIPYPHKTCALVVAVDSCGMGTGWDLRGARVAATLFVEWLKRQGVDPKRIYFPPKPEVDDIRLALRKLSGQKECDSLVLYWAGHGCETENDERCVFLADATAEIPKVFDIDAILAYIKHEAPHFTMQLGIIDSCATGWRRAKLTVEPIPTNKQLPQSPGNCHFVLAAAGGLESSYPDETKPSLFSRRVLELLDQSGMTVEGLIRELQRDYPVFTRDGRSKYWSGSPAQWDARTLEREVLRIGRTLNLEDKRWRAEARRLDSALDMPEADFRKIVERVAGWERALAGKICAALLLRGAAAANGDVRDAIQESAQLEPSYKAAVDMVDNLRAFENPSYLIKTGYLDKNLGATGVWFLSGAENCEPQRLKEWEQAAPLDDAIGAVAEHMVVNEIDSKSAIHVIAPLAVLLEPAKDVLAIERDYLLVFREQKRAAWAGEFRNVRPKFRDQLMKVKGRAALGFKLEWFEATDEDKWSSVEFPALRTGNLAQAEAGVERLLGTLAPFAAITRRSIQSLAAANEGELAEAIGKEKQFAKIPVRIYESRHKAGSILPHLTIIWDDPGLPKGYFH